LREDKFMELLQEEPPTVYRRTPSLRVDKLLELLEEEALT
jgi:hypothetical protein